MSFELDINTFRPDRPGIRKVLGDLEAEIMELIWVRPSFEGTSVRDIFEILHERRRIAYTTVMSTMTRLAKKKLLRVEKKDLAYIYYPLYSEKEFVSLFIGRILENLFISFSGSVLDGIETIKDPQTAFQVRQLFNEISRKRAEEEAE